MERNSKNNVLKAILISISLGIWILVLQNLGIIPTNQNVHVNGGYVDVSGTVKVNGSVDVNNTVDINVSEINGRNSFYDHGGDGKYTRIPVYTGN